jgi:hypothetical protein
MSSMSLTPDQMRRIVRRDVAVAGGGALAAIVAAVVMGLGLYGVLGVTDAARVAVVVTALLLAVCLFVWVSGPSELLRDRVIVLTPLFLVAGPGLVGVHRLGGGVAATMLSSAVGVTAAVALGMAWSVRRRNARG